MYCFLNTQFLLFQLRGKFRFSQKKTFKKLLWAKIRTRVHIGADGFNWTMADTYLGLHTGNFIMYKKCTSSLMLYKPTKWLSNHLRQEKQFQFVSLHHSSWKNWPYKKSWLNWTLLNESFLRILCKLNWVCQFQPNSFNKRRTYICLWQWSVDFNYSFNSKCVDWKGEVCKFQD